MKPKTTEREKEGGEKAKAKKSRVKAGRPRFADHLLGNTY
jgi:hypothetical protein